MDVFDDLTEVAAKRLRASALAPFVQLYWDRLREHGYSRHTARQYLNCLAHFAHWARRRRLELRAIDEHVADFVGRHLADCTCAAPVQRSRPQVRAALRHLATVIRACGLHERKRSANPSFNETADL